MPGVSSPTAAASAAGLPKAPEGTSQVVPEPPGGGARSTVSAAHYVNLDPEAGRWFVLCGYDDPAGVLAAMSLTAPGSAAHSDRHLWSHAATMVAVVTSIVGGVGAALAANAAGGGRVPVAACATVGAVVTVISASTFGGISCAAGGPPRKACSACSPPSQPRLLPWISSAPGPVRPTADP